MIRALSLSSIAVAAVFLAGCAKEKELHVTDAYVRFAPVADNPSAAYFTVHGGPQDVTLIGVTSPVAIRTEMHETMSAGGGAMAEMKPITSVQIPAGSTVRFEPGGKHLMLWNINPGIRPPKTLTLIFAFSNGERHQVDAQMVAAGGEAPDAKK